MMLTMVSFGMPYQKRFAFNRNVSTEPPSSIHWAGRGRYAAL